MRILSWILKFEPTTSAILLSLFALLFAGCSNADVTISGLKQKIASFSNSAPPWNQVNGQRQILSAGSFVMTVQANSTTQTQLSAGPYKMNVEVVK